jgi:hypothetical protein
VACLDCGWIESVGFVRSFDLEEGKDYLVNSTTNSSVNDLHSERLYKEKYSSVSSPTLHIKIFISMKSTISISALGES